MMRGKGIMEYDIHPRGARVDEALTMLDHVISRSRAESPVLCAVITGYGSSGGTSKIKSAVIAACGKYVAQNHIRGFLDGEFAGDIFSPEHLAFPDSSLIPPMYKRCPNPGIVFIAV